MTPSPSHEMLWRNYELHVKLYKDYLELVLKFNLFFYAVTGGVVSYCLSKPSLPLMRYGMIFPAVMSALFGAFFFYGARLAEVSRNEMVSLGKSLGFAVVPEYRILQVLLCISGALLIIIAIVLALVIVFLPYGIPIPPIAVPH